MRIPLPDELLRINMCMYMVINSSLYNSLTATMQITLDYGPKLTLTSILVYVYRPYNYIP